MSQPDSKDDPIDRFFRDPILNSPYEYPARHWELDDDGQPTSRIVEERREAKFISPIPKPKKRRKKANADQPELDFDERDEEARRLSTEERRRAWGGRQPPSGGAGEEVQRSEPGVTTTGRRRTDGSRAHFSSSGYASLVATEAVPLAQ